MPKILLLKPYHGFQVLSRRKQFSNVFLHTPSLPALHISSLPTLLPAAPRTALRAPNADHRRLFPIRAIESSPTKEGEDEKALSENGVEDGAPPSPILPSSPSSSTSENEMAAGAGEYPTGEFEMVEYGWWMKAMVKLRLLFALPWERVKKGSVLSMKLRGRITDQLTSRFSPGLSLPQICENFVKAAYDPRISGIYLHIEPLSCGWGKIDEIRRHILNFKKSGKFTVSYIPICGEKEYYLASACGEVYTPPSAYVSLYGLTVQASFLGGSC